MEESGAPSRNAYCDGMDSRLWSLLEKGMRKEDWEISDF